MGHNQGNQEISGSENTLEMGTPGVKELIRSLAGEPGHPACSVLVTMRPALGASGSASGVHSQRRIKIKINQFDGHDSRCGILPVVGLVQEIEECLLPCLRAEAWRKDC